VAVETVQLVSTIFTAVSATSTAGAVIFAAVTFTRNQWWQLRTQQWQQSRYAADVIDKLYTVETLRLAIRFVDWHDREMHLPDEYAHYGKEGLFNHSIAAMTAAMSTENRELDKSTGVYDLKKEFRTSQYMIYVEVFDQLFDYLSQLEKFIETGLVKNELLTPVQYLLARMNKLKLFRGYLEEYEVYDVIKLLEKLGTGQHKWAGSPDPLAGEAPSR
jgi:hypothetical protein